MTLSYIQNIRNALVASVQSNTTNNYTNFPKHKLFRLRIKQVATVSLIFLSMVTGEVFAGDKRPKSKASSGRKQEVTFESINLSSSLPDVVPQLPLPDLIPSTPPVTPPPPPLPDIVPPVILPDVVPVPPAPPMVLSQPHLLSDTGNSTSSTKSTLLQSIRDFGGKLFKLKKVKQELKPKVISSDEADLMSQILARREAIAGEKKSNKFKNAAKQVIVLTAEEQKAREAEISQKIAANKEKAATLRKQKEKEWAIKAKQIEAEVEIEKQRKAAEHARAMREKKAKENGSDSSMIIAGIDPVLHNNIVADLRQEISSLKEQLTLKGNDNSEGINDLGSNGDARSKRSLEDNEVVENKDQSTSTEDLTVLEDRLFNKKLENWGFEADEARGNLDEVISNYSDSDSGYDESLEDSSDTDSNNSLDTNNVMSNIVSQSNALVSITDTGDSQADANSSTAEHQKVLTERARFISRAKEDLRFGSKAVSKQIRHRLSARDIGNMVALYLQVMKSKNKL